jgi:ParB family chromosome partitioning protein
LILGIIEDIDICKIRKSFQLSRPVNTHYLFESVKEKGLLQPIIVRPRNEYFEIIAGNRRFEVCKRLGWKKIICHIVEANDKEAFEIGLVENIQRNNLDPIEEARSFRKYVDNYGWGGISELAKRIGKSVSYVDKRLKLLELPIDVINSISASNISPSVAEELASLDEEETQSRIANIVVENNLSSRKVRELIKDIKIHNSGKDNSDHINSKTIEEIDRETRKVFDKSITILKIASQKLGSMVSEIEENWIISEILMQHKSVLDSQIDLLIKQKKKI